MIFLKTMAEKETWRRRDLSSRRFVHLWADGGCFTPRLDGDHQCMLVVIGADGYGEKDILAVMDGFSGNADSWRGPLLGLRERGLTEPDVGDGAHRLPGGAVRYISEDTGTEVLSAQSRERHGGAVEVPQGTGQVGS